MLQLPKDIELSLCYLKEIMRHDKSEMLVGSSNAFLESLFLYIPVLVKNNNNNDLIKTILVIFVFYFIKIKLKIIFFILGII